MITIDVKMIRSSENEKTGFRNALKTVTTIKIIGVTVFKKVVFNF
jgi:hypothetical protein